MKQYNILAVDDEPFNLDVIDLAFLDIKNISMQTATNGEEALHAVDQNDFDTILLDLRMPVMDGFTTLKHLKSNPKYKDIPIIVVTANAEEKNKALSEGANDFLAKPIDPEELKLRTLNHAELFRHKRHLDNLVQEKTQKLSKTLQQAKAAEYEISLRLGRASEYRDLETGMHIKRMSRYSALLGRLFGFTPEQEELLLYSAPLHDIGKIGIPDAILLKPGKLSVQEFEIMKQHATIGKLMLEGAQEYPVIDKGKTIAYQHHEKYDGTGYPNGTKGEEIDIFARIVAIADVFDALSSKRVYKDPFPLEKTLSIMKEGHGTHFDPKLLNLFLDNIDQFLAIQEELPDKEETPHILNLLEEIQ